MPPGDTNAGSGHGVELAGIVAALKAHREQWRLSQKRPLENGARELPSREAVGRIVEGLRGALFPLRLGPSDLRQDGEDFYVGHTLDLVLSALLQQVRLELGYQDRLRAGEEAGGAAGEGSDRPGRDSSFPPAADAGRPLEARARDRVHAFAAALPEIRGLLDRDVLAAYRGDPAAHSVDEVLLCYPGIAAILHHRIAHALYRLGVPLLARMVSERAHGETGIDIHPGARIGAGFFIDHGTGVVIGETAEIGERVRLYQAVTLGARSFPADDQGHLRKGLPRHPIVEDDVVIYAGATLLGRITIGRGSTIGGNVWLTRSVAPGSHVTQATAQHA